MTELQSQDLFEPSQFNEDELINELFAEENYQVETAAPANTSEKSTDDSEKTIEKSTKLPLSRIKTLMKMDPELNLASSESVFLVARATEMFLKQLAQETYFYTAKAKRKTVQRRDVDTAIENIDAMCFLEGALD